jgi:hypothetical protein
LKQTSSNALNLIVQTCELKIDEIVKNAPRPQFTKPTTNLEINDIVINGWISAALKVELKAIGFTVEGPVGRNIYFKGTVVGKVALDLVVNGWSYFLPTVLCVNGLV